MNLLKTRAVDFSNAKQAVAGQSVSQFSISVFVCPQIVIALFRVFKHLALLEIE